MTVIDQQTTTTIRSTNWWTSSPHRRLAKVDGQSVWQPYSTFHARQVGESHTACGLRAIEWCMFFDRRFTPTQANACKDCIRVIWFDPREA